jgi:hypothetical protein
MTNLCSILLLLSSEGQNRTLRDFCLPNSKSVSLFLNYFCPTKGTKIGLVWDEQNFNQKKDPMKKTTKHSKPSGKEEFPGYPKYPASEDIMNREKKIPLDQDGTTLSDSVETPLSSYPKKIGKSKKTESDVTEADLRALNSEENTFEGDDEALGDRVYPVDFAGDDLDVPGSDLDDNEEMVGSEDEENNSYSLGGDNHQDLEEDNSAV